LDVWPYHPQLLDVATLADTFPGMQIVVCHLGGPLSVGPYRADRRQVLTDWRLHMSELAKRPNIAIKLGGFGNTHHGHEGRCDGRRDA
jgi:predicted TIM-barrel fold metal-dependent hydrolase